MAEITTRLVRIAVGLGALLLLGCDGDHRRYCYRIGSKGPSARGHCCNYVWLALFPRSTMMAGCQSFEEGERLLWVRSPSL
jgi:hypothetical protein